MTPLHPITDQVRQVRRRARRLTLLYGLGWTVAVALVAAVILAGWDSLIHVQDRGVRWMMSAAWWGAVVWSVRRFILAPLRVPLSELDIARRIEQRFPELRESLSAAVSFLDQPADDPLAGSPQLRGAVVHRSAAALEQLALSDVVQPAPARRAWVTAGFAAAAAAMLALVNPASAALALIRLVNPASSAAWPQKTHLAFKQPLERLAYGQPLELEVVDTQGAPLPANVWVHFRTQTPGQAPTTEKQLAQFVAGALLVRREQVTSPLAYRATGGDDESMPWIELALVEPPALDSLAITLEYPAYTGWSPAPSDKDIRALKGTRLSMRGTSTKPLRAATLCLESGAKLVGKLGDDGYAFNLPGTPEESLLVEESGSYWFELEDLDGLVGGPEVKYEIRAITDLPPTVVLERPDTNVYVTPTAQIPLRIVAKDDLALRSVELRWQGESSNPQQPPAAEQALPLFAGPEQAPAAAQANATAQAIAAAEAQKSLTLDHAWDLAPLELQPGAQLSLLVAAGDYLPQTGQSQPRRVIVISPDELQNRLAERQSFILSELNRVLEMQRESRRQVRSVEEQAQQVGNVRREDVDHLQGAELTQRQIERGLVSPTEGVRSHVDALLADLRNNRIDSSDTERQMQTLAKEIARLQSGELPQIQGQLTQSLKQAQDQTAGGAEKPSDAKTADGKAADGKTAGGSQPLGESLRQAGAGQDEVIRTVEQLIDGLQQWDNYRRFHRELTQLRAQQEHLGQETAALARDTLSKPLKDLSPQQQADLRKLAGQQHDLARQFDKVLGRMGAMQQQLAESDPLAADTLADAAHEGAERGVAGQMRQAAAQAEQNQLGQAAAAQQQAGQDVSEMLDILANRRESELSRLLKKLREVEQQLAGLAEQQAGLRKQIQAAAENQDEAQRRRELERLSREERRVQEETERLARRLQRLQAEQAGRTAAQAGSKMGQAGEQGEQGNAGESADRAELAEQELEQAQKQLAQRRAEVERDLAMEQLAKMEDALAALAQRQTQVVTETERLDDLRSQQGRLTRAQAESVQQLSREQLQLSEETGELAKRLAETPVLALALRGAGRDMTQAADLLDRRFTGAETLRVERAALRRLEQLLAALEPDEPKADGKEEEDEQQGGEGEGQEGQKQPSYDLAQLKLAKLMQLEMNERTQGLAARVAGQATLTDDQAREFAALSNEQGQLADLVADLAKPKAAAPEDNPDELPVIGPGAEEGPPADDEDELDSLLRDNPLPPPPGSPPPSKETQP